VSKRPYSGVERNRQVSDGRSALISEDRTDPFTESGNFDRDTQDDFVAQEFDKISVFARKHDIKPEPIPEPIPESIHEHVASSPMYSETQMKAIRD